jgi:hypothetical protein
MYCVAYTDERVVLSPHVSYPKHCGKPVVTAHGVTVVTHGYCEEHRCCNRCGLQITKDCKCKVPEERPEYLAFLKGK